LHSSLVHSLMMKSKKHEWGLQFFLNLKHNISEHNKFIAIAID
jgi:hypothetical protein